LISNIIATELVGLGKTIFSGDILINNKCFNLGSAIPLKDITLFTVISNIEMFPLSHSILSRAAGVGSILIGLNTKQALLKLKSG